MRVYGKDIIYLSINNNKADYEYNKAHNTGRRYYHGNRDYTKEAIVFDTNRYTSGYMRNWAYRSKTIMFLDDSELGNNDKIKEFYNNIGNKEVNITTDDVIYFSKSSAYPRHRLRNFTENKKTIKKEKADFIVVPNEGFKFETGDNFKEVLFIDKNSGQLYKLGEYNRYYNHSQDQVINYIFDQYLPGSTQTEKTSDNFLLEYAKRFLNLDLEPKSFNKLIIDNSNAKEDIIELYNNYSEKIISEAQLDSYINKEGNAIELNRESFDMLSKMLKGDQTNVSLGLRMMNSFDSNKSLIPIALLMLFNIRNICRNKEWNTVGMKVLRNKLPFINNYSADNTRTIIQTLNRLTKDFVKTDEDRKHIREYGMPMIKSVVDDFINRELKGIDFINRYEIILE